MSDRTTRPMLDEMAETLSSIMGVTIRVQGGYGGFAVQRVHPETGNSVDDLMSGYRTMKEARLFMRGMLATLSIQRDIERGR